jgi:hypothetical protein
MGLDPIGEPLRPACPGEREARRAENGDEDLRHAHFAGQAVNNRDAVTRIIDEELKLPRAHAHDTRDDGH